MWRATVFTTLSTSFADPLPGERDLTRYSWEDYRAEFGINAGDDARFAFEQNLRAMQFHNQNPAKSWFMTVNRFSWMTPEEFKTAIKGNAVQFPGALQVYDGSHVGDIPDRVDWREQNMVTPAKDQGGCGSCWAFSAAETYESHLAIATGDAVQSLSPQQIVSCAPNPDHCGGTGGCEGSTQPLAFEYLKGVGLTTELDYPYEGRTGTCQTSKIKPVAMSTGYVQLPMNNYTSLIDAVATKGPIAISVAASKMQFYGGGVLSNCNDYDMDHAVQLVGYGTDGGKDYWLVRNSWGSYYGEKGYVRIQRHGEGKEPCGVDSTPQDGDACEGDTKPRTYCGECGILSSSSYPTGMSRAGPSPAPTPPAPTPTPTPTPTPPTPGPEPVEGDCVAQQDTDSCAGTAQEGEVCTWCDFGFWGDCMPPHWDCNVKSVAV